MKMYKTLMVIVGLIAVTVVVTNTTFVNNFKRIFGANTSQMIYWGAYIDGSTYGKGYGTAPWDSRTLSLFEQHAGKSVSIIQFGLPWYNAKANRLINQHLHYKTL